MRYTLLLVLWFVNAHILAQENWVLDPGFEQLGAELGTVRLLDQKPTSSQQWWSSAGLPAIVFSEPREAVSVASDGSRALGLELASYSLANASSYVTGTLRTSLKRNALYCVCVDVILHRTSKYAARDIGFVLHTSANFISEIANPETIRPSAFLANGDAVSNTNWRRYCSTYRANGGERFISFGRFGNARAVDVLQFGGRPFPLADDYQQKAFYQLDQVNVRPLESDAKCGCAEENIDHKMAPPHFFVLDVSQSHNGGRTFDSLRTHLNRYIAQLPRGTPIALVGFTPFSRLLYRGEIDDLTISTINFRLDSVSLVHANRISSGMNMALDSYSPIGKDSARLVVFTDRVFRVTPEMSVLLQMDHEKYNRVFVLCQISAYAEGLMALAPYTEAYIPLTEYEMGTMVSKLNHLRKSNAAAMACPCNTEERKNRVQHLLIDLSKCTQEEFGIMIRGLRYVFEQLGDSAAVSVSALLDTAVPIADGQRMNMDIDQIEEKIRSLYNNRVRRIQKVSLLKGFSVPSGSINEAYRHYTIFTTSTATDVVTNRRFYRQIHDVVDSSRMGVSLFQIVGAEDPEHRFYITCAAYDWASQSFYTLSRAALEDQIWRTRTRTCDHYAQPYHRAERQGLVGSFFQEAQRPSQEGEFDFLISD